MLIIAHEPFCSIYLFFQLFQALIASFLRVLPGTVYKREIIVMSDGEHIALDWCENHVDLPVDAPIVIVMHGIGGNSEELNVQYLCKHLAEGGLRAVVYNRRGCAANLTLKQFKPYRYGCTADLNEVLAHINHSHPLATILAIGLSAGSNVLTRYLGETGNSSKIAGAISACNAFDLVACAELISKKPFYDSIMVGGLKRAIYHRYPTISALFNCCISLFSVTDLCIVYCSLCVLSHADSCYSHLPAEVHNRLKRSKSVKDFDHHVGVHIHGYKSGVEFHRENSSAHLVKHIAVPLICINAADDVVVPLAVIPVAEIEANEHIIFVRTAAGGHLGFADSLFPFNKVTWLERLARDFCIQFVKGKSKFLLQFGF